MKHKKLLIIFVLIIAIVLAYLLINGYTKINKYKLNVDNDYSDKEQLCCGGPVLLSQQGGGCGSQHQAQCAWRV